MLWSADERVDTVAVIYSISSIDIKELTGATEVRTAHQPELNNIAFFVLNYVCDLLICYKAGGEVNHGAILLGSIGD
jgi:hypothetical protein